MWSYYSKRILKQMNDKSNLMEYEDFLCEKYKVLLDEEELNPKEENIKELIDIKIKDVLNTLLEKFDGFRIHD